MSRCENGSAQELSSKAAAALITTISIRWMNEHGWQIFDFTHNRNKFSDSITPTPQKKWRILKFQDRCRNGEINRQIPLFSLFLSLYVLWCLFAALREAKIAWYFLSMQTQKALLRLRNQLPNKHSVSNEIHLLSNFFASIGNEMKRFDYWASCDIHVLVCYNVTRKQKTCQFCHLLPAGKDINSYQRAWFMAVIIIETPKYNCTWM